MRDCVLIADVFLPLIGGLQRSFLCPLRSARRCCLKRQTKITPLWHTVFAHAPQMKRLLFFHCICKTLLIIQICLLWWQ